MAFSIGCNTKVLRNEQVTQISYKGYKLHTKGVAKGIYLKSFKFILAAHNKLSYRAGE